MTDRAWIDEERAWLAEERRELQKQVDRYARLLRFAEMNGYRSPVSAHPQLSGLWWQVPADLVEIVGCMMARVG